MFTNVVLCLEYSVTVVQAGTESFSCAPGGSRPLFCCLQFPEVYYKEYITCSECTSLRLGLSGGNLCSTKDGSCGLFLHLPTTGVHSCVSSES